MAASVRIEDEAFSDRRYDRLAAECGLTDADHARGKMAVLWRQCTLEGRHVLPVPDVEAILGPSALNALVAARLGDKHPQGIRIRGTKGRIEWLKKLRENGAKGGRPRKPEGLASGSTVLNPPAPAPAPAQKTKTEDPPIPPLDFPTSLDTPRFRETWDSWMAYRREIKQALKPTTIAAQLKKLAKEGEAAAAERIERSIANAWLGLWFKDENSPGRNGQARGRPDPAAALAQQAAQSMARPPEEVHE